jgi:hypothetical protein
VYTRKLEKGRKILIAMGKEREACGRRGGKGAIATTPQSRALIGSYQSLSRGHYATSRKVAGSSPDEVTELYQLT